MTFVKATPAEQRPAGPLGSRIADLRLALGLSLRQSAKLCRMTDVDLGRIERSVEEIDVFRFADMVHQLLAPSRARQRARGRRFSAKMAAAMEVK